MQITIFEIGFKCNGRVLELNEKINGPKWSSLSASHELALMLEPILSKNKNFTLWECEFKFQLSFPIYFD